MPKFTLVADHGNGHTVKHEFEEVYLDTVVQNMSEFLRGTGYYFQGALQIADDSLWSTSNDIEIDPDEFSFACDPVESSSAWIWTVNELEKNADKG
jgi:hypothetical protein